MPLKLKIVKKKCAPGNFRAGRPNHLKIEAIVIHLIDGSQASCDAAFADTTLEIRRSAHYSISRTGEIHQHVDEADTAFHCGIVVNPTWDGLKKGPDGRIVNPNYYTIGIEHEGRLGEDWPDAMYQASALLMRDIAARHPALQPLTRRNVVMHKEIRATKACPGTKADLVRLIAATGGQATAQPKAMRARSNVNVRSGQPSTRAPIVRVIPAGELLQVRNTVEGESVNGVSRWYQNVDDDFIWAGAVTD